MTKTRKTLTPEQLAQGLIENLLPKPGSVSFTVAPKRTGEGKNLAFFPAVAGKTVSGRDAAILLQKQGGVETRDGFIRVRHWTGKEGESYVDAYWGKNSLWRFRKDPTNPLGWRLYHPPFRPQAVVGVAVSLLTPNNPRYPALFVPGRKNPFNIRQFLDGIQLVGTNFGTYKFVPKKVGGQVRLLHVFEVKSGRRWFVTEPASDLFACGEGKPPAEFWSELEEEIFRKEEAAKVAASSPDEAPTTEPSQEEEVPVELEAPPETAAASPAEEDTAQPEQQATFA